MSSRPHSLPWQPSSQALAEMYADTLSQSMTDRRFLELAGTKSTPLYMVAANLVNLVDEHYPGRIERFCIRIQRIGPPPEKMNMEFVVEKIDGLGLHGKRLVQWEHIPQLRGGWIFGERQKDWTLSIEERPESRGLAGSHPAWLGVVKEHLHKNIALAQAKALELSTGKIVVVDAEARRL